MTHRRSFTDPRVLALASSSASVHAGGSTLGTRRKKTTIMTTTILVWTSAKSAVLHSCQHGWHKLSIDTSTLTPAQRELLASRVVEHEGARYGRKYNGAVDGYDVAPPTADGLRTILQGEIDASRARVESLAARGREKINAARTAPIDSLRVDGEQRLCVLDEPGSYYGLRGETEIDDARALAGTDDRGRVPLADLGRLDEYRSYCARQDEIRADAARRDAEEREARRQACERQEAAERAKLREIVQQCYPEILVVLDAGQARNQDVKVAVTRWVCEQLGIEVEALVDVTSMDRPDGLEPAEFAVLTEMQDRATRLGLAECTVEIWHDETDCDEIDSEGALVVINAVVAGIDVHLELPIEHMVR